MVVGWWRERGVRMTTLSYVTQKGEWSVEL